MILIQIYFVIFILFYNFSFNFYHISYYYQNISLLNSKDNLCIILIIFLLIFLLKNKVLKRNHISIIIIFILLNSHFLIEVNKPFFNWLLLNSSNLNNNLLNGIMLIHPYILYFFYGIYLHYIFTQTYLYSKFKRKQPQGNNEKLFMIFLIFFAILLGCWWAEQELAWGGWWSWDFVELLALMFLIVIIQNIHTTKTGFFKRDYCVVYFCALLLSIFCVRFNIINSVHNFVNVQSQNQFFYYICIFIFILLLKIIKSVIMYNYELQKHKLLSVLGKSFSLLLLILYIYIFINIFFKNFSFFFFLNLSIKSFLQCSLIFILLYYNNNFYKKTYILYTIIILLFFKNFNYLDFFLIFSIFYFLKNFFKKNFFMKMHHVFLILFFFFTLHQTYNFETDFLYFNNLNLMLLKSTDFTYIDIFLKSLNFDIYLNFTNFFIKNNINVCDLFHLNNSSLFSYIFEKKMFLFKNINLYEFYNYNFQGLILLNNASIWLIFLMNILFLSFFLKKKSKYIYI